MVDVKFSLGEKDFVWVILVVGFLSAGFIYGYGTNLSDTFGYSAGDFGVEMYIKRLLLTIVRW